MRLHDWKESITVKAIVSSQVLISRITGHLRTRTQLSGYRVNQALAVSRRSSPKILARRFGWSRERKSNLSFKSRCLNVTR
jgi:hypothetical protein